MTVLWAALANNFKPQPIFGLVQRAAADLGGTITDEEMFRTFNMGWCFALARRVARGQLMFWRRRALKLKK